VVGAGRKKESDNNMRKLFIYIMVCMISAEVHAQTNLLIDKGNKLYEEQKYKEAASVYQKALSKNPGYTPGLFNLGNSLYQQKQFDASRQVMAATEKVAKDKPAKAAANYNIGNTYMAERKWEDAVKSYKQTLRNNPQDADAKYNLSYAEEMLKKQQGGGGKNQQQQKQDQKQNQQNKDNKDKDKDKDKQQQDQQNKDNKDQDKKDQQQPQSQPNKLSQQQADQLLNALQQEEKKLHEKQQKEKGVPVKLDKDW
jgi:tetratricopeptide (TPR) repeat protein